MSITIFRIVIMLTVVNFSAALQSATHESYTRSTNDLSYETHERSILDGKTTWMSAKSNAFAKSLGLVALASETIRWKIPRRRRRNDARIPAVSVHEQHETTTTLSQSSVPLSSTTIEGLPTRHSKHHRRRGGRRCKNRLGCLCNDKHDDQTRNRNMEKQLLVGNSSLALFRQKLVTPASSLEAGNMVLLGGAREIGNILADARSRRPEVTSRPKILSKIEADRYEKRREMQNGLQDAGNLRYELESLQEEKEEEEEEEEEEEAAAWSRRNVRKYASMRKSSKTAAYPKGKDNRGLDQDQAGLDSMYLSVEEDRTVIHHNSLAAILSRLFETLTNSDLDATTDNTADDLCQKWLDSRDKLEKAFLEGLVYLPACPCQYPTNIFYDDKIWDERQRKYFRWRDINGQSERIDVYKPGATYCVRSSLSQGSGHAAAAQQCCYDWQRRLLTRGSGAGTPNFISPEISTELHQRIDILPWRLCRGDFSRFNRVRPPNNDNRCTTNPDDDEYRRQIDNTKYY